MSIHTREKQLTELMTLCREILSEQSPNSSSETDLRLDLPNNQGALSKTIEEINHIETEQKLFIKIIPVLLKISIVTMIFFTVYEWIKQLVITDIALWQSHLITIIFAGLVASFGAYFPLKRIEILYQKSIGELAARRRAQAILKESEERYRHLFELESDALFLIDENTDQILEVNESAEKLYGYDREEFLRMKKAQLIDKIDDSIQAKDDQDSQPNIIIHKKKNGATFPVEISFSNLNWYGRKVRLSSVRDITERVNTHRRIESHRTFLKNVMDANPNLIYVIDRQNRIVLVNRIFSDVLGISPEQLIGKNLMELPIESDFVKVIQRDDTSLLSHEKHWIEREENYKDAEGNTHWLLSIKVPLKNDKGEVEQIIGVSTDITQRKKAEDDLKLREVELEMKSKNLEEVNTALKVLLKQREEDKKEMEDMFLGNVKDQVIPYIEKLKATESSAEKKAYIETIEEHLNDIISPFVTSITSKYVDLTPKEIQVASLIKDGKTTKEISLLLNISPGSVDLHRYHIRKKLGINKQGVNLRSYLLSLP